MGSKARPVAVFSPSPPALPDRDYDLAVLCRIFAAVRGYRERLADLGHPDISVALDSALAELYAAIVRAGE
jgi:hypothetical protein